MTDFTEKSTTQTRGKKRHWMLWLVLLVVVLPAALVYVYTWGSLHFAYSTGQRSGYVQKISRKGWICKTWEGELAMTTVPGTAPRIFQFSVMDAAIARQIEQVAGQPVALDYEQHKGLPTSCFGDTEFFATGVRALPH